MSPLLDSTPRCDSLKAEPILTEVILITNKRENTGKDEKTLEKPLDGNSITQSPRARDDQDTFSPSVDPLPGEVWQWYPDSSHSDKIYGPGIVLGHRDGWDFNSSCDFITFHFSGKGVMNIPLPMVRRFMYRAGKKPA